MDPPLIVPRNEDWICINTSEWLFLYSPILIFIYLFYLLKSVDSLLYYVVSILIPKFMGSELCSYRYRFMHRLFTFSKTSSKPKLSASARFASCIFYVIMLGSGMFMMIIIPLIVSAWKLWSWFIHLLLLSLVAQILKW